MKIRTYRLKQATEHLSVLWDGSRSGAKEIVSWVKSMGGDASYDADEDLIDLGYDDFGHNLVAPGQCVSRWPVGEFGVVDQSYYDPEKWDLIAEREDELALWVRPWRLASLGGPKPKWYRAYSVKEYRMIPPVNGRPPFWSARVIVGGRGLHGRQHNEVDVDLTEMVLSFTRPTDGSFTR